MYFGYNEIIEVINYMISNEIKIPTEIISTENGNNFINDDSMDKLNNCITIDELNNAIDKISKEYKDYIDDKYITLLNTPDILEKLKLLSTYITDNNISKITDIYKRVDIANKEIKSNISRLDNKISAIDKRCKCNSEKEKEDDTTLSNALVNNKIYKNKDINIYSDCVINSCIFEDCNIIFNNSAINVITSNRFVNCKFTYGTTHIRNIFTNNMLVCCDYKRFLGGCNVIENNIEC